MAHINWKALSRCYLRSQLIGSAFNTRGLQNIGLAYALEPGLQRVHARDAQGLQKARRRHLKLYNTHPFWNPLLVGVFLSLERKIANGLFPASSLPKVKSTLVYTLSAIGDSFFSGSMLVTWSLLTIILLAAGQYCPAIFLGVLFFVTLQLFKLYIFYQGYAQGLIFIQNLKKWNLINWGGRLKVFNSLLALGFWLVIWPFSWHIIDFGIICILALGMAWAFRKIQWSREAFLLAIFILALLLPWADTGMSINF